MGRGENNLLYSDDFLSIGEVNSDTTLLPSLVESWDRKYYEYLEILSSSEILNLNRSSRERDILIELIESTGQEEELQVHLMEALSASPPKGLRRTFILNKIVSYYYSQIDPLKREEMKKENYSVKTFLFNNREHASDNSQRALRDMMSEIFIVHGFGSENMEKDLGNLNVLFSQGIIKTPVGLAYASPRPDRRREKYTHFLVKENSDAGNDINVFLCKSKKTGSDKPFDLNAYHVSNVISRKPIGPTCKKCLHLAAKKKNKDVLLREEPSVIKLICPKIKEKFNEVVESDIRVDNINEYADNLRRRYIENIIIKELPPNVDKNIIKDFFINSEYAQTRYETLKSFEKDSEREQLAKDFKGIPPTLVFPELQKVAEDNERKYFPELFK